MNNIFFKALLFASEKHADQRRKGSDNIPYINHLIKVANLLYFTGGETDPELLAAALLHDVIEDTDTTFNVLVEEFGNRVAEIVSEVTDDMSLTYTERKQHQIKNALLISNDAKKIKIADKICNIKDILSLNLSWTKQRKCEYVEWAEKVVANCRGVNLLLDGAFDRTHEDAKNILCANSNSQTWPKE